MFWHPCWKRGLNPCPKWETPGAAMYPRGPRAFGGAPSPQNSAFLHSALTDPQCTIPCCSPLQLCCVQAPQNATFPCQLLKPNQALLWSHALSLALLPCHLQWWLDSDGKKILSFPHRAVSPGSSRIPCKASASMKAIAGSRRRAESCCCSLGWYQWLCARPHACTHTQRAHTHKGCLCKTHGMG